MNSSKLELVKKWFPIIASFVLPILCFLSNELYYVDSDGWYKSKDLLFTKAPPNHFILSPIGAPAIWYWLVDLISPADLELRFCHFFNYIFIALETIFLINMFRILKFAKLGIIIAFLYQLIVVSSQIANTVYSENLYILLLCFYLLAFTHILTSEKPKKVWCISFVVTAALMIATWIIPAIFFGISILYLAKCKNLRLAGKLVLITGLLFLLAPVSNTFRLGRFIVSDAAGFHLWNAVRSNNKTHISRNFVEFKELEQYGILKKDAFALPYWTTYWRLRDSKHPKANFYHDNEIIASQHLGTIALKGIMANPENFLQIVLNKTLKRIFHEYKHIWLPFEDQNLPRIVNLSWVTSLQHGTSQKVILSYPMVIFVALLLIIPSLLRSRHDNRYRNIRILLCYSFISLVISRLAMSAIEGTTGRYAIQALPLTLTIIGCVFFFIFKLFSSIKSKWITNSSR